MICRTIKFGNGNTVAIVCGSKPRVLKCGWCARPHTKLCDYKLPNGKDCDARICDMHAKSTGPNTDLCPDHVHAPVQSALF